MATLITDGSMMGWHAALLCVGGAVYAAGCLVPNRYLPARLPNDKLLHFAAFAALGVIALQQADDAPAGALWLLGLTVVGIAVECLQELVPDRGFSWPDIAANVAGLAFAAAATAIYTYF